MNRSNQSLFVAVDGGGSATRARIFDRCGNPLSDAAAGPANPSTNREAAFRNIRDAVELAYAGTDLTGHDRRADAICLALAGVEVFDAIDRLREQLEFAHVSIHSDTDATVAGALGSSDGIVAGIGTGSFFVSRTNGSNHVVGGHGFQISDECSGAWLGRKLLSWTVRAHDGMCEPTPLVDRTLKRFGDSLRDLVVFSLDAGQGDFAGLAPLVTEAADDGDPLAIRILDEATDKLCGILDFLNARSVGVICITGGLGPTYRLLVSGKYGEFLVDPVGDALDGAFDLLVRDMKQATHGL
ncbi:MAG: hypothetical protein OXD36_17670 [Rhodobacter sp.]|nr:hypothetical protein [Rhodobacter sp.]